MQQQEIDAELAAAAALLDSTSGAHLAYAGRDGTPRVVPVGYFWTGRLPGFLRELSDRL